MNWSKTLIAGVVGGIVLWIVNFVLHGVILGSTYMEYPEVFSQDESTIGILWFLCLSVAVAVTLAILFAKTRKCWAAGLKGGLIYGLVAGLTHFFPNFYDSLVIEGFPYFLAWYHGACDLISIALAGAAMGLVLKGE